MFGLPPVSDSLLAVTVSDRQHNKTSGKLPRFISNQSRYRGSWCCMTFRRSVLRRCFSANLQFMWDIRDAVPVQVDSSHCRCVCALHWLVFRQVCEIVHVDAKVRCLEDPEEHGILINIAVLFVGAGNATGTPPRQRRSLHSAVIASRITGLFLWCWSLSSCPRIGAFTRT